MLNRREFIGLAAAGAAFAGLGAQKGRILFGACRGFGDAPLMKELGYDFIEGGVAHALQPDKSDEEWKRRRDEVRALPIPLRSCNGFLPGKFRLTGEKASFDKPLEYAEKACRRADEVGLKTIVFGSLPSEGRFRCPPVGPAAFIRRSYSSDVTTSGLCV